MLHVHRWKLTYPLKYYAWKMYFLLKLSLSRFGRGHVNLPVVYIFADLSTTHPIEGARCIHPQRPKNLQSNWHLDHLWPEAKTPPPCDQARGRGRWWFGHPTHHFWTHKKKSAKIQTPKIHTLMIYIYNSTDSYHVSTKKCDMSRHVDLNLLVFFLMGFF